MRELAQSIGTGRRPPSMQYVRLGQTDLRVSRVGFGAIRLPQVAFEVADACLNRALDLGVNFVDTARGYDDSEAKIAKALARRRSEYVLATKTGAADAADLTSELEASLRELQTDHIDLYQLHSVSDLQRWQRVTAPGGALQAAKKAQQQGKVLHLGISIHRDLDTMRAAIACGEFESIMLAYNPLDPENVREEIMPLAHRAAMSVIIMKPLSGGALSARVGEEKTADPLAVDCLRLILSHPEVSVVIPGIESPPEIEANVTAADRPMQEAEKESLLRRIAALGKSFRYGQVCLQCGYCLPCPNEVPIPKIMRAIMMAREYPENLRPMGRALYDSLVVKADACEECETCLPKCPASLRIPQRLREALALFAGGA